MAKLIDSTAVIEAAGNKPKSIEEFVGRVTSDTGEVSIARMRSPAGWEEPGQTPEVDEFTVVIAGTLRVETKGAGRRSVQPVPAPLRITMTPIKLGLTRHRGFRPAREPQRFMALQDLIDRTLRHTMPAE